MERRSSIFDKPSATIVKDPRPLNDKTYMANCIRSLIKFLTESGFNQPIAPKTLASPSVKDFLRIFQFLYSQIDPHFPFGAKFEDEIPMLFKRVKLVVSRNKISNIKFALFCFIHFHCVFSLSFSTKTDTRSPLIKVVYLLSDLLIHGHIFLVL